MRKVSVIAITATYLDMTFAITANITAAVETGGYFVHTVICTIIWASFPMSLVNDMKGEPMSDLINRQAALDWLKNEWNGMVTSLFDGIKALPPAQPDRANGRWILDQKSGRRICSECLAVALKDDHGNECLTDFCSCCGSDMRGTSS